MKSIKALILLLLCCPLYIMGQSYTISGRVLSDVSGEAIDMATIRLFSYSSGDSTLMHGVQTDQQGGFKLNAKDGRYAILVSSVGFLPKKVSCVVSGKDISIKTIRLKEDVLALGEVHVQGHAAEMTVKGDTIEYNTAAYKVGENAMVEDVLKKMNGVTVDKEGNVTVNGEEIKAVRIDGKKFFGDDVQSATKNIPADMIDKIQVIDEKSDMAKLTGFEDDDSQHIINLTLKKDRKKGVFGKYSGALGADMLGDDQSQLFRYNYPGNKYETSSTVAADKAHQFFAEDFRYNASIFTNIMLGESQTTIIGGANNTNEIRMGRGRGGWNPQANSGITWAENLGLNTNIDLTNKVEQKDNKTDLAIGGDVAFSHSYNTTQTEQQKTSYASDSMTYVNDNNSDKRSKAWDVNVRLELEYQIDSMNKLQIQPGFSFTGSSSFSNSEDQYFRDSMDFGQLPISNVSQSKIDSSREIGASTRVIYNHKFQKPGRAITTMVNLSFTNTDGFSDTYAFDNLNNIEKVNQHTQSGNNNFSYQARLSYVEPIYKRNHLLETVIFFSGRNRNSQKDQYSFDEQTQAYAYDSVYSNNLKNDYYQERIELNYRWITEKSDLTAGMRVLAGQTKTTTYYGGILARDTLIYNYNFAPTVRFRYKFGKKEFARIDYRGNSNQPSVNQMEPVRNNSDAMNETVGNLALLPEFKHNIRAMYSCFNQDNFSSMMAGLMSTFTQDALVNNTIYDETGKSYRQTVNADALPWMLGANFMYNVPFFNKLFQFHTRTGISYNQHVSYINREGNADDIIAMIDANQLMLGNRSLTGNFDVSEDLNLRFTHNIVDIGVSGKVAYTRTTNSLTANSTTNVLDWTVDGDVQFHLPRNWEIAADCGYTARYGYKGLTDVNEIILNASVEKSWKAATLSLKAFDLLHQKKNILQTVSAGEISYAKFNTLPTYFLVTFTLKLNKMGSLKASGMGGFMQEMIEGGGKPGQGVPPMGPPR